MRTRRRIHPYVTPDLAQRLVTYCAAKGITESAAVQAAIEDHLAGDERDNEVILRRLDRLGRASARQQRDLDVLTESFAVFMDTWLAFVPERSSAEKEAAYRLSRSRYQGFIGEVATRLARGPRLVSNVVEDSAAGGSSAAPASSAPAAPAKPGGDR